MKNIVFIGMPGCGKSTLSKRLAERLGRGWYDIDHLIEDAEGMSIPELFTEKGEGYFRVKESECIRRLGAESGAVISTGGGAVLANGEQIRRNAVVIYLERNIKDIMSTMEPGSRPLVREASRLETLYNERRHLYESLSDYRIQNGGTIEETLDKIYRVLDEGGEI